MATEKKLKNWMIKYHYTNRANVLVKTYTIQKAETATKAKGLAKEQFENRRIIIDSCKAMNV